MPNLLLAIYISLAYWVSLYYFSTPLDAMVAAAVGFAIAISIYRGVEGWQHRKRLQRRINRL